MVRDEFYNNLYLAHHGILGQKWGVRRYQNPDGTLTAEGREHLGLNKEKFSSDDYTLNKGTKATRVTHYDYDNIGTKHPYDEKTLEKAEKDLISKYASVDGIRNKRDNGTEYYINWFSDYGYDLGSTFVDTYELKKDVRVAGAKKVVDTMLEEYGSIKLTDLINSNRSIKQMTLEYANSFGDLAKNVNERLKKEGYDAIEDINDTDTDMPIVFLNSKDSLTFKNHERSLDYLNRIGYWDRRN